MTTKKPPNKKWLLDPHRRLDDFAAAFDKQQKQLGAIGAQLVKRNSNLAHRSDELIERMTTLEISLDHAGTLEQKTKGEIARIKSEIAEAKDGIAEFEANAALAISARLGDDGKLMYSNEPDRKRATLVELGTDSEWKTRKALLRGLEFEKAKQGAILNGIEKDDKANARKYDAMRTQLENLTARMKGG